MSYDKSAISPDIVDSDKHCKCSDVLHGWRLAENGLLGQRCVLSLCGDVLMRSAKYQSSHHEYPCVFCKSQDETIVGHHINIKGLGGMGTKVSDALVIPVCNHCHIECHQGVISQDRQMYSVLLYWRERFIEKHGVAKGMDEMGRLLWEGLK